MTVYNKNFKHQNREAKIIALACLLFGGLFCGFGNSKALPMPLIWQLVGLSLIVCSVFIATTYLLREYRVSIATNDDNDDETDKSLDLIVYERKGKREPKVCHIALNTVKSVRIVTKDSFKKRSTSDFIYVYDNRFLWKERIEIVAETGDYTSSIYLAFDQSLLYTLNQNN